jgi:hypothetical protein
MYTGQIYKDDAPITVEDAVSLNLITTDENGDIWLVQDQSHFIRISGDLRLYTHKIIIICQHTIS